MKLSSETLQVLKNFQSINTNIILHPGNMLYTQNNGNTIFAMHEIAEELPQKVHIYELPSLLGVLSLSNDPDIEFGERSLTISNQNGGSFQYYYSDPSVVYGPPNKKPNLQEVYSFDMTKEEIQMMTKAAGIIGATTLSILTKDGNVVTSLSDPKTPGSNDYSRVVGEAEDKDFDIRISVSDLKMIPDNYRVSLTSKKYTKFESTTKNALYVIGGLANSRI